MPRKTKDEEVKKVTKTSSKKSLTNSGLAIIIDKVAEWLH